MNRYEALASCYDGSMTDGEYPRRADYLERLFRGSRRPVRRVLDLACGTGTIACLLAERGYRVTATDLSEEMLSQADARSSGMGERAPLFLHQSMDRLRLIETVDAAVSTLDALNYLTRERALRETFRRVYRYLEAGGLFIFDVNTPHKFRRMDRQLYMDETEGSLCVWRTFFSEKRKICTYQVDLFRRMADGRWDRSFEEHRERAWSEEELRSCLRDAGFGRVDMWGDLTARPPLPDADRWIFRCEK